MYSVGYGHSLIKAFHPMNALTLPLDSGLLGSDFFNLSQTLDSLERLKKEYQYLDSLVSIRKMHGAK